LFFVRSTFFNHRTFVGHGHGGHGRSLCDQLFVIKLFK
jgi:hypothetical protein